MSARRCEFLIRPPHNEFQAVEPGLMVVPLVVFQERSEVHSVSGVTLDVGPGELLGIIGPNGSGKTTLFNCVTGVLRPSGGQVRFKGKDITGLSADAVYRRGIARTFQLIQLLPEMTVLETC